MKKTYWVLKYTLKRNGKYGDYYQKVFDSYDRCIVHVNYVQRVYERDLEGIIIDISKIIRFE